MCAATFNWAGVVDYAKRYQVEVPKTQYELPGVTQEVHMGVPVAVPPIWHAVVTAKLAFTPDKTALKRAQQRLDAALAEIEDVYPITPAGILTQVAYGLNYFNRYIGHDLTDKHMPKATRFEEGKQSKWAIIDSIKFPKDPASIILENNDICFHFKSDFKEHIDEAIRALFYAGCRDLNGIPIERTYIGDLMVLTSIRRGFLGRSMPKKMARLHRIPGCDKIPDGAMLFMGFTSSHVHGLAQGGLPSFETVPGYTDATPNSYFANGSAMHLSHILIDLEQWYRFNYRERLHRMFNPRRNEGEGVLSPSQAPDTTTFEAELDRDAANSKVIGHNAQMQFITRPEQDVTTAYGEKVPKGTVIFLRQDFDTVENPFEFWAEGTVDPTPKAGVHFIGMGPSAQFFEKMRLQMDSVELQKKYNLSDENVGFTKMLVTTHRQNYMLPPRAHRSFPLAELL
jgi:hypothetical protein